MAGFENDVMVAKNLNFDLLAPKPHLGIINAAGKFPIGTGNTQPTAEILGGTLTSPNSTITIGYSSPNITIDITGGSGAVEHLTGTTGGQLNPDGSNNFNLHGGTVSAGTTPVAVAGAGSTLTTNVQISQAIASTDITKVGLSNFNSARFTVDANGFVSTSGTGVGNTITGNSGGSLSPTAGNWNIVSGITSAGSTPVTSSGSGSTLSTTVQISQAIASQDITKIGLSNFNSAQFTVDANGFVSVAAAFQPFAWSDTSGTVTAVVNNGYFITGTSTSTLPAAPAEGALVSYVVDTASFLTITASGTQLIRIGTSLSAAGGTAVNTQRGDSINLVYRSSGTTWFSRGSPAGGWNVT